MNTDDGDIRILIRKKLRDRKERNITVLFSEWDETLDLLSGSTKKHIENLSTELGFEVVESGSSMIELKKVSDMTFRIERG